MTPTSSTSSSEPRRTCVGCKRQDAKRALLRFAVRDEAPRLVPDVRSRLPGRGVNVHPRRVCLDQAVRRGGFARALRGKLGAGEEFETLARAAAEQYLRRLEGLLGAAVRGRHAAVGTDRVRDALNSDAARLLWVTTDAQGRRDEFVSRATEAEVPVVSWGSKQWLGEICRRSEVGVMGIVDEGLAAEVAAVAENVIELGGQVLLSSGDISAADAVEAWSTVAGRKE